MNVFFQSSSSMSFPCTRTVDVKRVYSVWKAHLDICFPYLQNNFGQRTSVLKSRQWRKHFSFALYNVDGLASIQIVDFFYQLFFFFGEFPQWNQWRGREFSVPLLWFVVPSSTLAPDISGRFVFCPEVKILVSWDMAATQLIIYYFASGKHLLNVRFVLCDCFAEIGHFVISVLVESAQNANACLTRFTIKPAMMQ